MRRACIDIGSNTTRLLVAEADGDGLRDVAAQRSFTRLGRGLEADGSICASKLDEVARVVAEQVSNARSHGAGSIRVVATAVVRDAPNRGALIDAVRVATGLEVIALSAESEARLAFLGASRAMAPEPDMRLVVVDVGGGSTELAAGSLAGGVSWWASLALGSGELAERHLAGDPPTAHELEGLSEEVRAAFAELEAPSIDRAAAVGGSATSLHALVGPILGPEQLGRALDLLATSPAEELAERFGLDPLRVRLLPAGILILREASLALGMALECGRGGLREGVLLEQFAGAG
jgi:exopolyphosphatase / guanosine-5'-triphosphate,3'-diphosphate pyrophosphatase